MKRGNLKLHEKAEIIEMYFYHKRTLKKISEITGFSTQTIANTVSLYFDKPKTNKTLSSKV